MRKNKITIFIVLFIFIIFAMIGCGDKEIKTEEPESTEEISQNEEDKDEIEVQEEENLDVYDQTKIAEFIMGSYLNSNFTLKEFMNEFQFYYFDVNEDNNDEVFLVPRKNEENIFGIMIRENKYKIIFNEEPYKYSNEIQYYDGFLKTTNKTGDAGETSTTISLWKWDGEYLQNVLKDLLYQYSSGKLSESGNEIEGTAEIIGALTEFKYIYKENGEIKESNLYKWNENEFKYDLEKVEIEDEINSSNETMENVVIKAENVKVGDVINGLEVSEIEVEPDYMIISFIGEINIDGSLIYDDYYQGFFVTEEDGKSIGITIEFPNGQKFDLPASVYIMNEEKFSQYENINLDNLMNEEGSLILGEFIVNDYSCMAYYESEFGVTGNLISANNMTNIY